jgi:cobalt-zinc-cadmium efflux system outer membrane protein
MSLSNAVEYVLQHNGELKALRSEKEIRESGMVRAGTLPNPRLDLEASSGALTGSSDESSVSLGISQEFLLAGKRDKRLAAAEQASKTVFNQSTSPQLAHTSLAFHSGLGELPFEDASCRLKIKCTPIVP